ncbi:hypothetical protein ISF_01810 [Cordyceps fumosorosea ARSEF 2679]|uniref:Uncharacterized protein n=1 Tax=Cordyceps fumosorosea (strain ARSEF 2679) TaxID=1081104 RepID=A0A162MVL7_CORFA|nr:hypothetical protein ISF_01810 [Cordyceps fumosorosea ARSEF 2679]OAA71259.1 hypothetical protein ISF_01810 [Cordyceps fumosorosea ARSEF 2679]
MKISNLLGLAAVTIPAASAFFLQIKDQSLASVGAVRVVYSYRGATAGHHDDAPYMGAVVGPSGALTSTADLGRIFFKVDEYRSEKGWYRAAFSNLEAPTNADIKGPFAVEAGKLVYKGAERVSWTMCPDSGDGGEKGLYLQLFLTTDAVKPEFGCETKFDLVVPQM